MVCNIIFILRLLVILNSIEYLSRYWEFIQTTNGNLYIELNAMPYTFRCRLYSCDEIKKTNKKVLKILIGKLRTHIYEYYNRQRIFIHLITRFAVVLECLNTFCEKKNNDPGLKLHYFYTLQVRHIIKFLWKWLYFL